jgi:exonuclease VII small subunit
MKIQGTDEIVKIVQSEKANKAKMTSGMDFEAILKEKIENPASKPVSISSTPLTTNPLFPAQMDVVSRQQNFPAVDRIEDLLDLLDDYRSQLADPQATLKDIHPLISQIEKEKEQLTPVLDSLADGDELKNILNQTLVTASLEVIKFNRGDYISS